MKMFSLRLRPCVLVLIVSTMLTACSMNSSFFSSDKADILLKSKSGYRDPGQKDHWLDNVSAWRNWDVSATNNQLVEWSFQENSISVKISSSNDLNRYAQAAHTLQIKVIQLTDVSGLKTLLQTADGVRTVLSESMEMIPSSVYSESILVAPNQDTTLVFARQQDAKFISVISGYTELRPDTSARILTIPVITIKSPKENESWFDKLTFGLFADEVEALPDVIRPARIKLDIEFGDKGIEQFAAKAY